METNFYSKSWRMNHLYSIVDKQKQTVQFKQNKVQKILHDTKIRLREKYGRARVLILKSRQVGITTDEVIDGFDESLTKSNQDIAIVAHTDETRMSIFDKVKFAYKQFPPAIRLKDGQIFRKPPAKYDTKYDYFFSSNNSKIKVVKDPRGSTLSKLHISEFAFIKNAKEMLEGALPSIPDSADITIETTANGFGNEFEKMWTHYKDKGDNATWTCLFLGWYLMDEYSLPLEEGEKVILPPIFKHLDRLQTPFGPLTQEQKKWYIQMSESFTDPRSMFQEYPSTPEEAFLTTGIKVFDSFTVRELTIPEWYEDEKIPGLRIYRKAPKKQVYYGGDTAEGVPDGDNGCIIIRDEELNLYACYYGNCDPGYLCEVVARLLELGYRGRIGVEKNNTGHAFYEKVRNEGYRRIELLFQTQTVDKKLNIPTQKVGWETNTKTRPIMMTEYKECIRKQFITETDERIQGEMYTMIYNSRMKEVAQEGHHDDGVMSDSICIQMRKYPVPEY